MFVFQKIGNIKFLRYQVELAKTPYREQKSILYKLLKLKNLHRACIDRTGIGDNLSEDAQLDFGKNKVEGVLFTNSSKEEMAMLFYIGLEDRNIRIDSEIDQKVIEDWHSIRKIQTKAGNIRLDTDGGDNNRHADNFWSTALANYAASGTKEFKKPKIISGLLGNSQKWSNNNVQF